MLLMEHNMNILLVEMRIATGEESADHMMKLTTVILASRIIAKYTQLVIVTFSIW